MHVRGRTNEQHLNPRNANLHSYLRNSNAVRPFVSGALTGQASQWTDNLLRVSARPDSVAFAIFLIKGAEAWRFRFHEL